MHLLHLVYLIVDNQHMTAHIRLLHYFHLPVCGNKNPLISQSLNLPVSNPKSPPPNNQYTNNQESSHARIPFPHHY